MCSISSVDKCLNHRSNGDNNYSDFTKSDLRKSAMNMKSKYAKTWGNLNTCKNQKYCISLVASEQIPVFLAFGLLLRMKSSLRSKFVYGHCNSIQSLPAIAYNHYQQPASFLQCCILLTCD